MFPIVEISADTAVFLYALGGWILPGKSKVGWENAIYGLGLLVMIAHVLLAYGITHHWSHAAAIQHTASETERVVGIATGFGVYVNFVFLLVYAGDLYWSTSQGRQSRTPKWLAWGVDGFLASMVLMATILFEEGPVRYVGFAVLLWIVGLRFSRSGRQDDRH